MRAHTEDDGRDARDGEDIGDGDHSNSHGPLLLRLVPVRHAAAGLEEPLELGPAAPLLDDEEVFDEGAVGQRRLGPLGPGLPEPGVREEAAGEHAVGQDGDALPVCVVRCVGWLVG